MKFIEEQTHFHDGDEKGSLIIENTQEITQDHLDFLKDIRNEQAGRRYGEGYTVQVSVPKAIYNKWMREGFDMQKEGAERTKARLRAEGLDCFIIDHRNIGLK
ncbi:hypothetical protein [Bosea sp. TAF32]|uniref:hypothetical protein n=1 Tax=Bosea sp. TAF32 TaxID=3237482 RepID=UPI003F919E1E